MRYFQEQFVEYFEEKIEWFDNILVWDILTSVEK